ncbi:hypothetical protein HPB49_013205 [Dermacentor silvarum]|uniref:Uncharacterized protein n=1 Tax=Dermacentor silvarum TaxID=543639 RepID=A0ACB8CR76_DERSI|nr:hypothetical protein HPB49_013205 [Dermacentor silvarum]
MKAYATTHGVQKTFTLATAKFNALVVILRGYRKPPVDDDPEGPYPYVYNRTGASGGHCLIVQDYRFGKYLGFLDLKIDRKSGNILDWSGNPILLNQSYEQDEEMLASLKPYKKIVDDAVKEVVGSTKVLLEASDKLCRYKECNAVNLMADAFFDYYSNRDSVVDKAWSIVNAAVLNAGIARDSIQPKLGNTQLRAGEKMGKIQPFYDEIFKCFHQFGVFHESLSIDESMGPYYGPHSCKMFIRGKPILFGYKMTRSCQTGSASTEDAPDPGGSRDPDRPADVAGAAPAHAGAEAAPLRGCASHPGRSQRRGRCRQTMAVEGPISGNLTLGDVLGAMPYDSDLVVMNMTGLDLLNMFEFGVTNFTWLPDLNGRFLQGSGTVF